MPHKPSAQSVVALLSAGFAKYFEWLQNLDFVLSLGDTGVAQVLSAVFGWFSWIAIAGAFAWVVWDCFRPFQYPRWVGVTIAAVAAFALGINFSFGLVAKTPRAKTLKSMNIKVSQGRVLFDTTVQTDRLGGLRDKGDLIVAVFRAADESVDQFKDEHIITSREFTIPTSNDFVIETELPREFMDRLGDHLLSDSLVSIPNKNRREDIKRLSDVTDMGGRILASESMGFRLEIGPRGVAGGIDKK